MKKILTILSVSLVVSAIAQPVANCSMMCVLDITLDTANNEMVVVLFSGDTNQINYPTIQVIDNSNGDTVGNPQGIYYFFMQGQGTMVHNISTTLTTIPPGFTATVLVTDQVWDTTCYFQYPMSCPMNVQEQDHHERFEVYPNPASDFISISLPSVYSGKIEVHITNMLGEVFAGTLNASNGRIELSVKDLAAGVYFVTVIAGEERYIQRIVRQ